MTEHFFFILDLIFIRRDRSLWFGEGVSFHIDSITFDIEQFLNNLMILYQLRLPLSLITLTLPRKIDTIDVLAPTPTKKLPLPSTFKTIHPNVMISSVDK